MAALHVTTLSDFLARAGRLGFAWGTHDCMLFAADWVCECTGRDPAAAWRGTYTNEAEALALIQDAGGASCLMHRGLAGIGWDLVQGPVQPGDVVLARLPAHDAAVAAIAAGRGRVACLMARGLALWPPADLIAAWTPSHA